MSWTRDPEGRLRRRHMRERNRERLWSVLTTIARGFVVVGVGLVVIGLVAFVAAYAVRRAGGAP